MTKSRSILGQETSTTNRRPDYLTVRPEPEEQSFAEPELDRIESLVHSGLLESYSTDDLIQLKTKLHLVLTLCDEELAHRVTTQLHPSDSTVSRPSPRQRLSGECEGTY